MRLSDEQKKALVWPGILLVAILFVFAPTLIELAGRWFKDPRYNHGYFVPLFSLYLIYRQRDALSECTSPSMFGLVFILLGLAIRAVGTLIYLDWLDALALLPCLAGVVLLAGGWQALKLTWPALAFVLFMVPLPFSLETAMSQPLQQIGTVASSRILRILGYAAVTEGNVIRLGDHRVGVAEACNGLSMLMIFFALCTAVAILTPRPLWERALIVATAVPIALAANILRIVAAAIAYLLWGDAWGKFVHDKAGWAMMPVALVLLWVGVQVFNLMFPIRTEQDDAPLFDDQSGAAEQPAF